jgi:hypothetical protein
MFLLLEQLNKQLREATDRRVPIVKVTSTNAPTTSAVKPMTTVLDVQHLTSKDTVGSINRLIKQVLSQFKSEFDFNFETKESGMFNALTISAVKVSQPVKYIQFEISELTNQEISNIKRSISIK